MNAAVRKELHHLDLVSANSPRIFEQGVMLALNKITQKGCLCNDKRGEVADNTNDNDDDDDD